MLRRWVNSNDRRARKKAQTREQIRSVAQRLFAEQGFDAVTIADIAREADVAVQTVFNHFATKEELFFDGRTPWVDGAGRRGARPRRRRSQPLTALRALPGRHRRRAGRLARPAPNGAAYVSTLEASDALRAHERELVLECGAAAARDALLEAWTADAHDGARCRRPGSRGAPDRRHLDGRHPGAHRQRSRPLADGADPRPSAADGRARLGRPRAASSWSGR